MEKYQLYRTALDAIEFLVGLDFMSGDDRTFLKVIFQKTADLLVDEVLDFPNKDSE